MKKKETCSVTRAMLKKYYEAASTSGSSYTSFASYIKKVINDSPFDDVLYISKEKIWTAHDIVCQNWKEQLEQDFPDVFPKLHDIFPVALDIKDSDDCPVVIGQGLVPLQYRHKCLVTKRGWKPRVKSLGFYDKTEVDRYMITFEYVGES